MYMIIAGIAAVIGLAVIVIIHLKLASDDRKRQAEVMEENRKSGLI